MLAEIVYDYAANPGTGEDGLRLAHQWAKRTKDTALLARLAGRNDLPDDVRRGVDKESAAVVVTARLTRSGVSQAELDKAAVDKRATVQQAVASAAGLPGDVYRTVLGKAWSARVLHALAVNEDAPADVRTGAIASLEAEVDRGTLNWQMQADYYEALSSLLTQAPFCLNGIALSQRTKARLSGDDRTPMGLAASILSGEVAFYGAYDWQVLEDSPVLRWDTRARELAQRFLILNNCCAYVDVDDETVEQVKAIASRIDQACSGRGAYNVSTGLARTLQRRRGRSGSDGGLTLEAVLQASDALIDRLGMVEVDELDDESFVRLVRQGTSMLNARMLDENERQGLSERLSQCAGRTVRTAALLSRYQGPDEDYAHIGSQAIEVMGHLALMYGQDVQAGGANAYSWATEGQRRALMHAAHNLPEAICAVPVAMLGWVADGTARDCCPGGTSALSASIMDYLVTRLGLDVSRWDTFEKLAAALPATLEEAADTTLASLE